jgi:hypothetical protein
MTFIETIRNQSLTNGEHYDLMYTIVSWITENKLPSKLSMQTKALTDALSQEEAALALSRKSPLSDQIHQADAERDIYLQSLRHTAGLDLHIAELADPATQIIQLFTDYHSLTSSNNLADESGILLNFVADLEGKAAGAVAALGMESMVRKLKTANDRVVELMKQRDEEKSQQTVGIMRQTRQQTDVAFHNLVEMVDALVVVEGSAPYAAFIDFMNTLITRTKRQSLKQKVKTPANNGSDNNGAGDAGNGEEEPPQG